MCDDKWINFQCIVCKQESNSKCQVHLPGFIKVRATVKLNGQPKSSMENSQPRVPLFVEVKVSVWLLNIRPVTFLKVLGENYISILSNCVHPCFLTNGSNLHIDNDQFCPDYKLLKHQQNYKSYPVKSNSLDRSQCNFYIAFKTSVGINYFN